MGAEPFETMPSQPSEQAAEDRRTVATGSTWRHRPSAPDAIKRRYES